MISLIRSNRRSASLGSSGRTVLWNSASTQSLVMTTGIARILMSLSTYRRIPVVNGGSVLQLFVVDAQSQPVIYWSLLLYHSSDFHHSMSGHASTCAHRHPLAAGGSSHGGLSLQIGQRTLTPTDVRCPACACFLGTNTFDAMVKHDVARRTHQTSDGTRRMAVISH